ncbi:MAG: hypothetical protein AB7G11_02480 [Phycisphaerales bacterium]
MPTFPALAARVNADPATIDLLAPDREPRPSVLLPGAPQPRDDAYEAGYAAGLNDANPKPGRAYAHSLDTLAWLTGYAAGREARHADRAEVEDALGATVFARAEDGYPPEWLCDDDADLEAMGW